MLEAWLADDAAAATLLDRFATLLAAFGGSGDDARALVLTARQVDADRIRAEHEARH